MFLEFLLPCLPAIIILASPTAPFVNVCGASWSLSVLGWRRAGKFWSTDKGPSGAFSCLCAVDDVGACPRLRRSPCHSSESTWVACMKGSFGGRYATLDYGAKPPDSFSVEWTDRCCPCVAVGRWPSVFRVVSMVDGVGEEPLPVNTGTTSALSPRVRIALVRAQRLPWLAWFSG